MKRKTTIRKLRGSPVSRKFYHLLAELHSVSTRLEHLGAALEELEFLANAERSREKSLSGHRKR